MKKIFTISFLTLGVILISGCINEQKSINNSTMTIQTTSTKKKINDNSFKNEKNLCIEDFQKQEIPSARYPKYTLSKFELDNFKNIMGINSFCLQNELGQLFLNVDWDSKNSDLSFKADSGRMISLGFKNLFKELAGWGNGYIVYSTYDFSIGTEYYVYATKSDYEDVINNKKNNVIEINGVKTFIQYKWHSRFEKIQKIIVFPFENYYVAIVYELSGDYYKNYDQIITDLYANQYPKEDEIFLHLIDDFVKSIKFKNQ